MSKLELNNLAKNHSIAEDGEQEEGYNPPKEIMILPKNPIEGRDGRKFNYNAEDLIKSFAQNAQDIPVDINHEMEIRAKYGEYTAAAGWVKSITEKNGEIWGQVEWTDKGHWNLADKSYKYISPAFFVEGTTIKNLSSVSLVNTPNFRMPALNNRESKNSVQPEEKGVKHMEKIANKLNLNSNSSEDVVINAITELQKNLEFNTKAKEKAETTLAGVTKELNTLKQEVFSEKKTVALNQALEQGKILPSSKNYYEETIMDEKSLNSFNEMVKNSPSFLGEGKITKPEGLEEGGVSLNAEQKEFCKANGIEEKAYIATKQELFKGE